ncbi:uncharacterized protein BDV14DRAFT_21294 [Aspergillus stella-maris]|uniref:uncharacterized protein n=1 Tax=Aspergillus stella-maris TaxID=1810926 RepID=UPI003CCD56BA
MSPPPTNPSLAFYAAYRLTETSLGPRDHISIFVETGESGPETGHRYHVIGNIQEGMTFNHRTCIRPEDEPVFQSKTRLGHVSVDDYESGRFRGVCEEVEVPEKQFEGAKRLFPGKRLRRCGEWVGDAIKLLIEKGVLILEKDEKGRGRSR